MKFFSPWLRLFRFPNLPTVPGDALAGGVVALFAANISVWENCACFGGPHNCFYPIPVSNVINAVFGASLVVLFAYMFGLADNDIAGAKSDAIDAPERPIPAGEITLAQAKLARTTCLLALVVTAYLFKITYIYPVAVALLAAIIIYNRFKGFLLMGLCRGLGLVCGVVVVLWSTDILSVLWSADILSAFFAWTLYTAGITWLASDEHIAERGMGKFRFVPGLAVLLPLALMWRTPKVIEWTVFIVFSLAAYAIWFRAVWPLGKTHAPAVRRRAVGRAIGALMLIQMGFIFAYEEESLWIAIAILFLARFAIRFFQPKITGS